MTDEEVPVTDETVNRVAPIAEAVELGLIEDDEPPPVEEDESPVTVKRGRGRPRKEDSKPSVRSVRTPLPRWKDGAISEFATKIYTVGGATLAASKNERAQDYGTAFMGIAEPAGIAWEKIAKRNEIVRRFFDKLMTGGDVTELIFAHAPLFVMMFSDMGILRFNGLKEEFETEMDNLDK